MGDGIIRPTKQRLASEYSDVERVVLDRSTYPCTLPPASHQTHDLAYYQSILNHPTNFAERTKCDVFDIGADGIARMRASLDTDEMRKYIDVCDGPTHMPQVIVGIDVRLTGPCG